MFNFFYNHYKRSLAEGIFYESQLLTNVPIPFSKVVLDNDGETLLDNDGNIVLDNG